MRSRLASSNRTVMAARTTRADRYIGVELGRCPGAVALVAGSAVCRSAKVIGALAGGIRSIMATGAVGGTGESAVVSLGARPNRCRFMTTLTTCRCRQVRGRLARCSGTVVTA